MEVREDVKLTSEQKKARRKFAELSGKDPRDWKVLQIIPSDCWYDFYDSETGAYGQCRKRKDGTWTQAPRGKNPTILAYRK